MSDIRIDMDGRVYKYECYCYVPWEMHGMRGCLLPEVTKLPSGTPLPYASTYVLVCDICPVAEVARGCHSFPVQTVCYYVSLGRVRSDNEWDREEA